MLDSFLSHEVSFRLKLYSGDRGQRLVRQEWLEEEDISLKNSVTTTSSFHVLGTPEVLLLCLLTPISPFNRDPRVVVRSRIFLSVITFKGHDLSTDFLNLLPFWTTGRTSTKGSSRGEVMRAESRFQFWTSTDYNYHETFYFLSTSPSSCYRRPVLFVLKSSW